MSTKGGWKKSRWIGNALAVCLGVLLYVALEHGWFRLLLNFFYPVTAGAAIAYMVDPVARLMERSVLKKVSSEKWRRVGAVLLALALIALFLIGLLLFLIPQLIDSVNLLINNMQSYLRSFQAWLNEVSVQIAGVPGILRVDPENISQLFGTVDTTVEGLIRFIVDNIGTLSGSTLDFGRGIMNFSVDILIRFMNGALAFILSIYFLLGKNGIIQNGKRLFQAAMSDARYARFYGFVKHCNEILIRYILFDLVDGLIVGVANWIFMILVGMPYAVLISVVVGVTNLAPTFGPIVGGAIGAFILLLINPWYALAFVIFTFVLQTLDGYVIKPRLFGEQLGVSSVLILVFLIVGGRVFGIYGVLLSIPVAAIVDFSFRDYLMPWLEKRKKEREMEEAESASAQEMQKTIK